MDVHVCILKGFAYDGSVCGCVPLRYARSVVPMRLHAIEEDRGRQQELEAPHTEVILYHHPAYSIMYQRRRMRFNRSRACRRSHGSVRRVVLCSRLFGTGRAEFGVNGVGTIGWKWGRQAEQANDCK